MRRVFEKLKNTKLYHYLKCNRKVRQTNLIIHDEPGIYRAHFF